MEHVFFKKTRSNIEIENQLRIAPSDSVLAAKVGHELEGYGASRGGMKWSVTTHSRSEIWLRLLKPCSSMVVGNILEIYGHASIPGIFFNLGENDRMTDLIRICPSCCDTILFFETISAGFVQNCKTPCPRE